MRIQFLMCLAAGCGSLVIAASVGVRGAPPKDSAEAQAKPSDEVRYSVDEAKSRAKLMQHVYVATLDAMHHHYFRANRSVLPARAMEDVFSAVAQETGSTARWISVNTPAMSVDHEPETDFEKQAVIEITAGKTEYSAVDKEFYRSASAIPLTGGCLTCHVGLGAPNKIPRFAGLVISVPVDAEE